MGGRGVPPWMWSPNLPGAHDEHGPNVYVYDEEQLNEAINDAVRDTVETELDQVTVNLAHVAHTIVLAGAFRFTEPCIIPANAVGLVIRALPGIRLDVEDGLDAVFDVRGILTRIQDLFVFNGGVRNADAFVVNSLGVADVWVTGNYITACKRLVRTTGTGSAAIDRWRIKDNFFDMASGTPSDAVIDLADADDCHIVDNDIDPDAEAIRIRAGSYNTIRGNHCHGGEIQTDETTGGNTISANMQCTLTADVADDTAGGNTA